MTIIDLEDDPNEFLRFCRTNQSLFDETEEELPVENAENEEDADSESNYIIVESVKIYDARLQRVEEKYGISSNDFIRLLKEQDYRCKICNKHWNNSNRGLHLDHCHSTKKIRGLLCGGCNRGLGSFRDSVEYMARAILYLNDEL